MIYLFENSELNGRTFALPDGIKGHLNKITKQYKDQSQHKNYHRLLNIINDGKIKFEELKQTKFFFDNYTGKKNTIDYQLNGGDEMRMWAMMTLQNATNRVKDYKTAKKNAGVKNAFIKPHTKNRLTKNSTNISNAKVQTNNVSKNISNNNFIRYEHIIRENGDDGHIFYNYLTEYDAGYVLNLFVSEEYETEPWGTLINPSMYQKALSEFMKFGYFVNFPTKYVYQWMGIIMKNTVMLMSNSEIAGHTQSYPLEAIDDILLPYYNKKFNTNYTVFYSRNQSGLRQKINYDNIIWKLKNETKLTQEEEFFISKLHESNGIHPDGQKDLFMSQDEVNDYSEKVKKRDSEKNQIICKIYNNHFQKQYSLSNSIMFENNTFYEIMEVYEMLEQINIYEWLKLPDGSDGWSDYGIEPLIKIIEEYNSDMKPEKVLVLINRILDVYHQRGGLSSMFITGGANTLNKISNSVYEKKRKVVIIKEKQLGQYLLKIN